MTIKEFYANIGGDYNDVLLRLPSDALVIRFVKRFASEGTYRELMEAIEQGNISASFEAAHKFKGIVANMAFRELYCAVSDLTEQLRPGDREADPALLQKVSAGYHKVITEISRFEQEI